MSRQTRADRPCLRRVPASDVALTFVPLVTAAISALAALADPAADGLHSTLLAVDVGVLFACSVALLAVRVRRGLALRTLASVAFIAGFIFWYGLPALLDVWQEGSATASSPALAAAGTGTAPTCVLYLAMFFAAGALTPALLPDRRTSVTDERIDERTGAGATGRIVRLALLCAAAGFSPYVFMGGGVSQVIHAVLASRTVEKAWIPQSELGNATTLFTTLSADAVVCAACLLWAVTQERALPRPHRITLACVALLLTTVLYFDQGTRSLFALVVLPPFTVCWIRVRRRSTRAAYVVLVAGCTALLLALQYQLVYRAAYTRADVGSLLLQNLLTLGGTSDFFKETLYSVALIPAYHPFFHESPVVEFLLSVIPRALWPSKPTPQLVWFYTLYRWGIDIRYVAGNALPGVIGQFYMDWGWIGPAIAGAAFGWISWMIDRYLGRVDAMTSPYRATAGLMGVVWLLLQFRLLSPGFFYPVLFLWLIIWLSGRASRGAARELPVRKLRRSWNGRTAA